MFLVAQLCIVFKKIKYVAKQLYPQCRELGAPVEYLIPSCLYEKEPLQLCFIDLRKKAVVFLCRLLAVCFSLEISAGVRREYRSFAFAMTKHSCKPGRLSDP